MTHKIKKIFHKISIFEELRKFAVLQWLAIVCQILKLKSCCKKNYHQTIYLEYNNCCKIWILQLGLLYFATYRCLSYINASYLRVIESRVPVDVIQAPRRTCSSVTVRGISLISQRRQSWRGRALFWVAEPSEYARENCSVTCLPSKKIC